MTNEQIIQEYSIREGDDDHIVSFDLLDFLTNVDPAEVDDIYVRRLVRSIQPLISLLEERLNTYVVNDMRDKVIAELEASPGGCSLEEIYGLGYDPTVILDPETVKKIEAL